MAAPDKPVQVGMIPLGAYGAADRLWDSTGGERRPFPQTRRCPFLAAEHITIARARATTSRASNTVPYPWVFQSARSYLPSKRIC